MNYTYLFIGIAAAVVLVIAGISFYFIRFKKMTKEEKREFLITYLMGLVAMAEECIGSGMGAEKLEKVEDYFEERAPRIYKIILKISCQESLSDLIEVALSRVKKCFGNKEE